MASLVEPAAMRADGLLHADLLGIIARLGHGQTLVIADAGLPIDPRTQRIDLAVRPGLPPFLSVLESVLEAGVFEAATMATELPEGDPELAAMIRRLLDQRPVSLVTHDQLKVLTAEAVAVVRTGQCTPFANLILRAGVSF